MRFVVLCILGVALVATPAFARDEYQVKGAFLFNFARYVTWSASPADSGTDLPICVAGDASVTETVSNVIGGKTLDGRRVSVHQTRGLADAGHCRVLFVTRTADLGDSAVATSMTRAGLLTVGEDADFLTRGGVVRFTEDAGKIRFEVNQVAARSAGLKFSANLLRLAKRVID